MALHSTVKFKKSLRIVCAATMLLCSTSGWAFNSSKVTHNADMNAFVGFYQGTYLPQTRNAMAYLLYQAVTPIYANSGIGVRYTWQQLAADPVKTQDTYNLLTAEQQLTLQSAIRTRINNSVLATTAEYIKYKNHVFSDADLNVFNQVYHPNLRDWYNFQDNANPSIVQGLKDKVAAMEVADDARRLRPQSEESKIDRLDETSRPGEILPIMGSNRVVVERAQLKNTRSTFVSWWFGNSYDAQSKIEHGVELRSTATNQTKLERDGASGTALTSNPPVLLMSVKSDAWDLNEDNIRETIEYYVNKDIDTNGPFINMTPEDSRRNLRHHTENATREVGDPYVAYTMAATAVRAGALAYLAYTRANIYNKKIDFAALANLYNNGIGLDPVVNAAMQSAASATKERIRVSSVVLATAALYRSTILFVGYIQAKNAVNSDPNLTREQHIALTKQKLDAVLTNVNGWSFQLAALGVYNLPALLTPTSSQVLRTWATYWIPLGFAANDLYGATTILVDAYRANKNMDPGTIQTSEKWKVWSAAAQGAGALYTIGDYGFRWFNLYYRQVDINPWISHTLYSPINMNTYTAAAAGIFSLATFAFSVAGN